MGSAAAPKMTEVKMLAERTGGVTMARNYRGEE